MNNSETTNCVMFPVVAVLTDIVAVGSNTMLGYEYEIVGIVDTDSLKKVITIITTIGYIMGLVRFVNLFIGICFLYDFVNLIF